MDQEVLFASARSSRAPYGARGLKSQNIRRQLTMLIVAPRMGRVD